jgi:predicted O-methyltransferase YrrM
MDYQGLSERLESVPGFLPPQEGFALYLWARDGPGLGAVVEIGSLAGRSTAWLAYGSKAKKREKVVAVNLFQSTAERDGGAHAMVKTPEGQSSLPVFLANIERLGLRDWVEPRTGASTAVARGWTEPIRLLFIDADHSYESVRSDYEAWSRFVIPGGVIAFHDVGVWPGVTRFHEELLRPGQNLREVQRTGTLRVFQRVNAMASQPISPPT